jgi:hypothetical protein
MAADYTPEDDGADDWLSSSKALVIDLCIKAPSKGVRGPGKAAKAGITSSFHWSRGNQQEDSPQHERKRQVVVAGEGGCFDCCSSQHLVFGVGWGDSLPGGDEKRGPE